MTPPLQFRVARPDDLDVILGLLADDPLGKYRELTGAIDRPAYERAMAEIAADPHSDMIVALQGDNIVGCLQLTLIPGLSRGGAKRAQIEAVRIASRLRGRGIGTAMMKHAIDLARARGAKIVQLTSDTRRTQAHQFYKNLGFSGSHTGFKLDL